jgi:hypothetical protein
MTVMKRLALLCLLCWLTAGAPVRAAASAQSSGLLPKTTPFSQRVAGSHWAEPDTCAWHIVDSPNKNTTGTNYQNQLNAVVSDSATDAWAGGYYFNSSGSHSLLEHWNGTSWSLVTVPVPTNGSGESITSLAGTSSSDVWAIGQYFNTIDNEDENLTMHYDGASWAVVPIPSDTSSFNYLTGISEAATGDAWAVGYDENVSTGDVTPEVMHWNGSVWSSVTSYVISSAASLITGVDAFGPFNVYTGGYWSNGSAFQVQGAHYNGAWTLPSTPDMGSKSNVFNALVGNAGTNLWGIGEWNDGTNYQSLAEHWNGSAWTIVPSPDNGGPEGSGDATDLFGAAVVNANDVWAVGYYFDGTLWQTYAMQWTGAAWATVASPDYNGPDTYYNRLNAAARIPVTNNVWAVGFHGVTPGSDTPLPTKTLILKFHC